jgi:hypothetical protein
MKTLPPFLLALVWFLVPLVLFRVLEPVPEPRARETGDAEPVETRPVAPPATRAAAR